MTLAELIETFRVDVDDLPRARRANTGASTNTSMELLWSNKDLARWFSEAEAEAALRKRLIYDAITPEITEVEVTPGTNRYALDSRLFEVRHAWLFNAAETQRNELAIRDIETVQECWPYWRSDRAQPTTAVIDDKFILLPNQIIQPWLVRLEGFRLPLVKFSADDLTAAPEIGEIHHIRLVDWVKYRAYQKPDSEALNPGKAAEALSDFEDYFGYRLQANQGKHNQADRPHHVRSYW